MPYTNMFEIIDDNGTIHSGTRYEMQQAFNCMHWSIPLIMEDYGLSEEDAEARRIKWGADDGWTGDLKLIQIHDITR